MRQLTSLAARKRHPGEFVATLEGGEEFILHQDTVARHGISSGQTFSDAIWAALLLESDRLRCMAAARAALSRRPLTAVELRRRLAKARFPQEIVSATIDSLRELGALNDEVYADLFAEARTRRKAGPRLIEQGLRQRGVSREVARRAAQDATSEQEMRQNAHALLEKWQRSARQSEPRKRAQAAAAFLIRKGYQGELVWEIVREVLDSEDS